MLGMAAFTPQGINGAVLQMFNHGTITAMLFLLVGVIYDRAHHREIDGFGGLASIMPVYTGVTGVRLLRRPRPARPLGVHLRGAGAPRRLAASTRRSPWSAASAVVLTAGYMLWTLQRVFLGHAEREVRGRCPTSTARELFTLVPLGGRS